MINKKICMLGAFSVGKTALVQQYVNSIFTDRYMSTVGVKISKKLITLDGREIGIVLWDMEGKDDYADVNISYLRGAMGFFVVADGTRHETLEIALKLRSVSIDLIGNVPHRLLVNKADIAPSWEVTDADLAAVSDQGIRWLKTSAKTGLAVNEAFVSLAQEMVQEG